MTHFDGMAKAETRADLGSNMITALDNLANAAVQKNDTVYMLVVANKALTDSLAARDKECARLLAIVTALSTGRGANLGGGGGGGGGDTNGNGSKTPWDPAGYCWSHGYKVSTGHSSAFCRNKREGHVRTSMQNEGTPKVNVSGFWHGILSSLGRADVTSQRLDTI